MNEWENYFMLTGTGSITLIGLLFIVITFGAERTRTGNPKDVETYLTPSIVHFSVVFAIALAMLLPRETVFLSLSSLVLGVLGMGYVLRMVFRLGRAGLKSIDLDAGFFHLILPFCGYATLAFGFLTPGYRFEVLAATSAILLLTGVRNAWAAAVSISLGDLGD